MKRSALLVLSSLLLTSASYAGNTKCEDCYDLSTKNAAALHHTTSKPNSAETKYWDDYIHSGQKDITVYVRDLSRKDAQAALWFITTGGKHGFAAREATAQERICLEDAIKHVAISYGTRSNTGKGLQEWSQVSNANHAGHLHLQMIYRKIDDLNFKVNNLESEVKLLKAAQEKTDAKYNNLFQLLQDETKARTQSVESFNQTVKDQMDRVPILMKPMIDEIKEMAQKSETKWTAIWEDLKVEKEKDRQERLTLTQKLTDQKIAADTLLETEKEKIQAEVDRQKDKKKTLKDQVAEYKVKETAAEKAKAVADALKEEREAAAERERQREKEIRREREAAAEREKKADKANADLRAGLAYLINARSSGQPNIDYDRIKALLNPNAN